MARAQIFIAAAPERVFDVLADPQCYPEWVVGAHSIRDADPGFPAVGTRFHHRVGVGPLTLADHTEVLDVNAPYRLELRARARPLGTAKVTMLLEPRDEGTSVTMIEEAADPLSHLIFNPLTQVVVGARNVETLRRLKRLVEQRAQRSSRTRRNGRPAARAAR
jgi:uncharacterized protein YndB with AHSA1/START domain